MENELFNQLKVGYKLMSREFESSTHWSEVTVTKIDGLNVTFEDSDGMEINSSKEEINEGVYFKSL